MRLRTIRVVVRRSRQQGVKSDNPKAPPWRVLKAKPREGQPIQRDNPPPPMADTDDIGF